MHVCVVCPELTDNGDGVLGGGRASMRAQPVAAFPLRHTETQQDTHTHTQTRQIGRASCRERV